MTDAMIKAKEMGLHRGPNCPIRLNGSMVRIHRNIYQDYNTGKVYVIYNDEIVEVKHHFYDEFITVDKFTRPLYKGEPWKRV